MDYAKEVEELKKYETTAWFKPDVGTYKIKILGEGEFVQKTFKEEQVTQWNLPISVQGLKMTWSVTKGKSMSSIYGQIMFLCAKNNNSAVGVEFDLIVKSDGKKRDYTIPQAYQ
jgi:hypothetical protein